ncbi:MAG: hypothetical protein R2799_16015 [Crocinitomicaceae bacterium]|nr:hypothetical protein [Crocinitomicaceae bacterium]
MNASVKVGIIGDFSFMYNAHHATNHALEHSKNLFEANLDYYWIRTSEIADGSDNILDNFDGIIIAPGPYQSDFFMKLVIKKIAHKEIPVLGTGEPFKMYLEYLGTKFYSESANDIISDNENKSNHFEKLYLQDPNGKLLKMYGSRPLVEYSSVRYSLNPEIQKFLEHNAIDVLAKEENGNLLAFSDKEKPYMKFSVFCPQVLSSEALPHPIFTTFIEEILKFKLIPKVI